MNADILTFLATLTMIKTFTKKINVRILIVVNNLKLLTQYNDNNEPANGDMHSAGLFIRRKKNPRDFSSHRAHI